MKKYSIFLAFLALGFVGCEDDDDKEVPVGDGTLSAHFHPVVGMDDLVVGNNYEVNGDSISWELSQFYISDVKVWKDASGNQKETLSGVYKLVKPNHADIDLGQLPAGSYYGIEFYVGIADSTTNHADPSLASGDLAPQNPSMHWSWNSGYIFLKIEGTRTSDQQDLEFHVGTDKMATKIMVQKEFTIQENATNKVMIMVDHGAMLAGLDFDTENNTHTMDNMPLAKKIMGNLKNSFK
jgi:hypothetical protein